MLRIAGCLTGLTLIVAGVQPSSATTAAPTYSQARPPPVCNGSTNGPCVAQPNPDTAGNAQTPTLISEPTLARLPGSDSSGPAVEATFVITSFSKPNAGFANHPVLWTTYIQALPIQGDSDPAAGSFNLYQVSDCTGQMACSYTAGAGTYSPGWYAASDINATLTYQESCPPSPNGVYGCTATISSSAFYVPGSNDLEPPQVKLATKGQGLTTKAVAAVRDAYGKATTLVWDFGDGSSRITGTPRRVVTHSYSVPGDYRVTALVRTSDGRTNAMSADAGILPPRPNLQAVDRIGTGTTGVAAGLLQGWPQGASALLRYWNSGCPADPESDINSADGSSNWAFVNSDGTINLPISYLDQQASGFMLEVQGWVQYGNRSVEVHGFSSCVNISPATAATTTGAVAAGDTVVPVAPVSVPDGDVAVIDAGTVAAEQRTVQSHDANSLVLADQVAGDHASGVTVVDAGAPLPPYVVAGPPSDPTTPTIPGGPTPTAPGAPKVTGTHIKHPTSAVVAFTTPGNGGAPITSFNVQCVSSNHGHSRHASGKHSPVTVSRLTPGKRYTCRVRAVNLVGAGRYSSPGKPVSVPARHHH